MFDFDDFREIWSTIRKNKLRTFLTGFSVSWGIFMLILLLGAGNGLRNGVMHNFRNMSMNRVQVWGGYTIMQLSMTQVTASLGIPMGVVYIVIPLSGVLIAIYSVLNIIDLAMGIDRRPTEEE